MRTHISLWLALFALVAWATAATPPLLDGSEMVAGPVAVSYNPPPWGLDYIGSPEQIGTTWYDYQHNGSMSRMIAYGPDGSIHCCWMNGLVSGASQRVIYYNRKLTTGVWQYGNTGIQVNSVTRAGFCTMDLDPAGNAVIAYHGYGTAIPNLDFVYTSTGEHQLPAPPAPEYSITWPHVCVDIRGYIHVIGMGNNSSSVQTGVLYYTRSQDGGLTWIPWQFVDSLGSGATVSQTTCADLIGGKVALAWTKPITVGATYNEDVYYVESLDGVTWNFANKINLTNFSTGGHPASADSRCYDDVNLLYDDEEGTLHVAYTTVQYPTLTNGGKIWYWSQSTGHRYVAGTYTANAWTSLPNPGAWRRCIDRPSLGTDATWPGGILYCQWGQCTTPGDVSAANYGNWDVYVSYSPDYGTTWMAPVNVTETATPGAVAGQCLSENWANSAKRVTDKIHIQYIKDLDAGGIPQAEGSWTLNPVVYQAVPIDSILTQITADLTPPGPPIVIPPGGGSFNYTLTITNTGIRTLHFDGWLLAVLPNGNEYSILIRPGLTLPPGGSLVRAMTQNVPGNAPPGNYSFVMRVGNQGWNTWAEDSFPFSKSAIDGSSGGSWTCSGWAEIPVSTTPTAALPTAGILATNFPNPFNPATTISYTLPVASHVTLSVYNLTGAEVARLVNGPREAGAQEVSFNGSALSSGVYLYRIKAGELSFTGKLILMK